MRRKIIGLAVLTLAIAAPAWGDDKPAPDDEKLYGTWAMTMVEFMGNSIPTPADQEHTFAFAKGGKVTLKKAGEKAEEGTYKLGAAKTPREIDLTAPAKDGKPAESLKALYQVDGDTLKVAFPLKGPQGDRPTAIDPKTSAIMTFKRLKP